MSLLGWLPLVAMTTTVLVYWFVVAFFSDNNFEWYTSEFVQIVTGVGALIGIVVMIGMVAVACWRWARRLLGR